MKINLAFLALCLTGCTSCVHSWSKPLGCQEVLTAFMAGEEPVKFSQAFDGGVVFVKSQDGKIGQAIVFVPKTRPGVKAQLMDHGVKFGGTCLAPNGVEVDVGTDEAAPISKVEPPKDVM